MNDIDFRNTLIKAIKLDSHPMANKPKILAALLKSNIETKSVDMSKIDGGRIVKTGLQTGIGAAIPAFGEWAGNAVDAVGTALISAEASVMIVGTDVVATNTISAAQSPFRRVPRIRHRVAIHER